MTDFGLDDRICNHPKPNEPDDCLLLRALMWHGLDDRPREWERKDELETVEG